MNGERNATIAAANLLESKKKIIASKSIDTHITIIDPLIKVIRPKGEKIKAIKKRLYLDKRSKE